MNDKDMNDWNTPFMSFIFAVKMVKDMLEVIKKEKAAKSPSGHVGYYVSSQVVQFKPLFLQLPQASISADFPQGLFPCRILLFGIPFFPRIHEN